MAQKGDVNPSQPEKPRFCKDLEGSNGCHNDSLVKRERGGKNAGRILTLAQQH